MSKLVENYLLQQPVGKGVYGQVFRAIHQKTKQVFAVKVIPKSSFKSNPKLQQLAINEINILSSIKHLNIVRFVETLKTPNNFYFVYEFCNQGTLESTLKKRKFLKQAQALIYFKQLLEAFKQLNKNNIMHRDLKPDNIFLSDGVIKLGDFGFCKMLEVNMAQTMLGSPIYMAPQILKQQIYTSKADIWSLGVVLFEMLFGYCPFQSSSISQLINKLKDTDVSIPHQINSISQETQILIRKMLIKDQFKRIQWADLFEFVIDQKGKIISGCKKQFAIQNLQRYFLNDNQSTGSTTNVISTVSNSASNISNNRSENDGKYNSFKQIESAQKNLVPDDIKQKLKSGEEYHPYTVGFIPHSKQEQFRYKSPNQNKYQYGSSQNANYTTDALQNGSNNLKMMKKMQSNDSEPSSPFEKLTLKHKAESTPAESISSSKKKIEKEKFGEIHSRWLDAVKLVQDLALNSVDSNYVSVETCIFILLKKLLQRLERQSQYYPEWTDVLIQEKMGIKQTVDQIQKSNKQLMRMFENQKQNRNEEKQRKQLMKIWEGARNKFTLQRAIRATFDRPSKQISIQQILNFS